MRFVGSLSGSVLALSLGLAVGCARLPANRAAAQAPPIAAEPATGSVDPEAEQIAQAHAHYAAGIIHEMNEETEAALQEYYLAARNDPENEGLLLEVSRRFIQDKQPEKALDLLSRAATRPNVSGAVLARLGLVYGQLGKYEQAAAADRAAIARAPEALAGYQNLFLTYLQDKQPAEALKVLDEAARQAHPNAEFLVGVGELYGNYVLQFPSQKSKVEPKALAVLTRAEKLKPSNPALLMRLADALSATGAGERAAEIYLELLAKLPDVPLIRERVHAKLANIYLRSSDSKRALEQLQAFLRDEPTNPQANYYLGRLLYEQKKPAEAIDYFNKAILLQPNFEEAYYSLALAQLSANATSDALGTLEKARQKFPASFDLELWTGLAYSRQKAWPEAVRHYTAAELLARASDPTRLNAEFYFEVGAAYERSGDLAQAEEYFQKCLKLSPDFASAQNYLGYMWAEHGLKLHEARELIEKAVKQEPKNPAYLDSLGWVLYKLNLPKEALGYILKAVELSPEPDPTLLEHLGDIYAALKQPDKAREAWRKSLALEANEEVQKKLDSLTKH